MEGVLDQHWEDLYSTRDPHEVSWFEPVPAVSLELIEWSGIAPDAGILDVGGGASTLAAELVRRGYTDVTVADVSSAALARAQAASPQPEAIDWVLADVRDHDFGRTFDLWHDRALFHFMVSEEDRAAYVRTLERSLAPGGHVVIATFGPEGPTSCSGLPAMRYDGAGLAAALGGGFELRSERLVEHRTPGGRTQQVVYVTFGK